MVTDTAGDGVVMEDMGMVMAATVCHQLVPNTGTIFQNESFFLQGTKDMGMGMVIMDGDGTVCQKM